VLRPERLDPHEAPLDVPKVNVHFRNLVWARTHLLAAALLNHVDHKQKRRGKIPAALN